MTRQAARPDPSRADPPRADPSRADTVPPHRPGLRKPVPPGLYRRRRLAAALAALLLIVGLGLTARVVLYDLGLADVAEVRVTGAVGIPVDAVLDAAGVTPGGPLAAVDLNGVAGRVARMPAVESVRVGRDWPHAVAVDITERVPVALTTTIDGPALVDHSGVVYPGAPVPGLPQLTVPTPGTDDPATLAAVSVLVAVPAQVRPEVVTVDVTVDAVTPRVTLGLSEGREIRWGAPDRGPEKAAVLLPLLEQDGQAYDVSSPELPTIRP